MSRYGIDLFVLEYKLRAETQKRGGSSHNSLSSSPHFPSIDNQVLYAIFQGR